MTKTLNQRIGLELRVARIRAEITQEELAAAIKVPSTSISHWESGRRPISIDNLYKVSRVLRCEPSDFMPKITALNGG